MINYFKGSLFESPAICLVNAVNCGGVMGAGIALEFKKRYPKMFSEYRKLCERKIIKTGEMNYYKEDGETKIVNFPTKDHYVFPSKIEWIEQGLIHFLETYEEQGITSVAFPKLGCGKGGLNWEDVKPLMEKYLSKANCEVFICLNER